MLGKSSASARGSRAQDIASGPPSVKMDPLLESECSDARSQASLLGPGSDEMQLPSEGSWLRHGGQGEVDSLPGNEPPYEHRMQAFRAGVPRRRDDVAVSGVAQEHVGPSRALDPAVRPEPRGVVVLGHHQSRTACRTECAGVAQGVGQAAAGEFERPPSPTQPGPACLRDLLGTTHGPQTSGNPATATDAAWHVVGRKSDVMCDVERPFLVKTHGDLSDPALAEQVLELLARTARPVPHAVGTHGDMPTYSTWMRSAMAASSRSPFSMADLLCRAVSTVTSWPARAAASTTAQPAPGSEPLWGAQANAQTRILTQGVCHRARTAELHLRPTPPRSLAEIGPMSAASLSKPQCRFATARRG